jgi:tetratricopeptide (TPR) repeat protein
MKSVSKLTLFVIALLVLTAGAHAGDDSPLHAAVKQGDNAQVNALLTKGADVNAKDTNGWTPLHSAAMNGAIDIAELLLAKGADVNAKTRNDGATPLYWVLLNGKNAEGMAKWLLAKGADVNAKTNTGDTPLHNTEMHAKKDIAVLLLANGADVNDKGNNWRHPLDWALSVHDNAIRDREKHVAELLEEYILKQARSNPHTALVQLTAQLKDKPDDLGTRYLILKLASETRPPPAIPEEARKHSVEGAAIKTAAKNPAQQALAAQSFTEALKVAPWWGDAYYNLGVTLELAEKYDEAEKAFNFYLLSNPSAAEKREVQDRIYALSAKRKLLGVK